MASIPLGPGMLTFGESGTLQEFGAAVTAVSLEPSYSDGDVVPFLDGSEDREQDEETWTLNGTIQQQLTADALEDWCFDHRGEEVPFTFVPNGDDTGKHWSGTVRMRAVTIGGDVKSKNTSDFELPMLGAPTRSDAGA